MCCKKEVFLDLCELYPETEEVLRELSLHKRDIYLHYLKTAKNMKETIKHSGVPRGIDSRAGLFRKQNSGALGRNVITLSDDEDDKAIKQNSSKESIEEENDGSKSSGS